MKGWKLEGKLPVRQLRARAEELEATGHETHLDKFTGVLYYRKKKKSKLVHKPVVVISKPVKNKLSLETKIRRILKLAGFLSFLLLWNWWIQNIYLTDPTVLAKTYNTAEWLNAIETDITSDGMVVELDKKTAMYGKPKTEWTVEDHIMAVFGKDSDWALRCLKSENARHNPTAKNYNRNGTTDRGIFQINSIHCGKVNATSDADCESKLFDVETNVKVAYQIFKNSGKRAWYGKTCR